MFVFLNSIELNNSWFAFYYIANIYKIICYSSVQLIHTIVLIFPMLSMLIWKGVMFLMSPESMKQFLQYHIGLIA